MTLHITKIGRDALDRVLRFLDPEGSNPSIANARSKVRLANPSEVMVQSSKGMISFEIRFQEGLLRSFKMERIPVGGIKNLRALTQAVPHWQTVTQTMTLMGAEGYGVDEDGTIFIR